MPREQQATLKLRRISMMNTYWGSVSRKRSTPFGISLSWNEILSGIQIRLMRRIKKTIVSQNSLNPLSGGIGSILNPYQVSEDRHCSKRCHAKVYLGYSHGYQRAVSRPRSNQVMSQVVGVICGQVSDGHELAKLEVTQFELVGVGQEVGYKTSYKNDHVERTLFPDWVLESRDRTERQGVGFVGEMTVLGFIRELDLVRFTEFDAVRLHIRQRLITYIGGDYALVIERTFFGDVRNDVLLYLFSINYNVLIALIIMIVRSLFAISIALPAWLLWDHLQQPQKVPVIGIFTQPSSFSEYPSADYTYIASSYVKFLEQSGAKVIYIPYEAPESELDVIFKNLNGMVLPGGSTSLTGPTLYSSRVGYLVNKAMEENKRGEPFPIFAICLGHQLLHYVLSGYDKPYRVDISNGVKVLRVLQDVDREAKVYSALSDDLFQVLTTESITYYHHIYAVVESFYMKHPEIAETLRITARNTDSSGTEFIAATEGITYPILTTQYHPEKSSFEWTVPASHSKEAVQIFRTHSNVFVKMTRQNPHVSNQTEIQKYFTTNYSPVVPINGAFSQIYLFQRVAPAEKEALVAWEKQEKA